MSLCLEYGYTSLNHIGEELCGDMVDYKRNGDYFTIVLADGLGSGVKANILSTLTSKILTTLISNNVSIDECLKTMVETLPVCKERKVAYSTFTVIHVNTNGEGYLFEFDNPQAIYIHDLKCQDFEREKLIIEGKIIYKTPLNLKKNDTIVFMSDGCVHAGIGNSYNFGWQREQIMEFLEAIDRPTMSARALACELANACNDLYQGKPGDDTTVAAIKIRDVLKVNIMVGPPVDKDKDDFYVSRFLSNADKTVVCGGTSSHIVARYLNTNVISSLEFPDKDVPPIGYIDGIDLTTEGVFTLRKLLTYAEQYASEKDLRPKTFKGQDGAQQLAQMLFEEATHVEFFVGESINSAHVGEPINITMKLKLIESLAQDLQKMGKQVIVNYD